MLLSLVFATAAVWTACEVIDTSTATNPSLQPHELPRIGQTPLPVVANNEVSLTIRASERVDDVRFKTGDVPKPQVDNKALEQLLMQLTVTLDVPHVALFAVLDSTGTQWNYGYTNLSFHEDVLEQANGKSRPFLFTRVNEDGFMVVVTAMLPDTPSALLNFRRYLNVPTPSEVQSNEIRSKQLHPNTAVQSTCGGDGVLDCAILTWDDGHFDLMCWPKICIEAESLDNDWWDGGDAGGGSGGGFTEDPPCMADPLSCLPGGGSSIPSQNDCSGVLNGTAYTDKCNRCVGGNTGRQAANDGDDCSLGDDCKGTLGGSAYLDSCDMCVGGTTNQIACCATMTNNITRMIEDEGGYVNHPNDRGGKTKYGITKFTWNNYAGRIGVDPTSRDVSTITENEAHEIYERIFYPWSNAEAIARMDGDLAMIYFNFFVNTPRGAVEAMQNAVVHLRGSEVFPGRGRMGQMTLDEIQKLINEGRVSDLHNRFKIEMQRHYNNEVANDSNQSSFINGWTNRINKFPNKTDEHKHNLHCK